MSDAASHVAVRINGDTRKVPVGQPLAELLAGMGLPPQGVLVEHNGQALLRSEWDSVRLAESDSLEILRVVAGG